MCAETKAGLLPTEQGAASRHPSFRLRKGCAAKAQPAAAPPPAQPGRECTQRARNASRGAASRSGRPGAQVAEDLRCPDQSALITLATAQPGAGKADWVDALLVATDGLVAARAARPPLAKSPVRWLLVSDLRARVSKVANLEEILEAVGAKLRELEARAGRARRSGRRRRLPQAGYLLK